MTALEYNQKLDSFKRSDAPYDVKEKAINDLEEQFHGTDKRNPKILDDIKAGAADISDMSY